MPRSVQRLLLWGPLACLAAIISVAGTACSGHVDTVSDSPRHYSDEEIGLDELLDNQMLSGVLSYARYRTIEESDRARPDPTQGSGHERERALFEQDVRIVMLFVAGDTLPPDVALESGVLYDAETDAMDECAADAGWPGVQLYDVSNDVVEQYERDYGLTLEMFLDLRHECAKYAATYPTLDPAYRDELLAKRRAHYETAVREFIAANPDLVVPIEYHEGANQPMEDYWIEACKQSDDPEQCARDNRVTLP